MKVSIARRLALMFALAAVLITSTSAVLLRCSLKQSLDEQMHNELILRHSVLDPLLSKYESPEDWVGVHQKLDTLTPSDERVLYWVLSDDSNYSYGGAMPDGQARSQQPDGFSVMEMPDHHCPMVLLTKTIPAMGSRPELRFIVGLDSTPFMGTLGNFTRALIFTSALGIALAALLGYWVSRLGLRPVRRLSNQANSLPPGDSKQRLETEALPSELQELAVSFNGALARQEAAWCQLEGFNANVAHELRTPLTNLIGQTQVALVHDRDLNELQDLLQSNLEELERMGAIVNDMLFLAGAESGQRATELSDVSLYEEASKTVEYLEPVLFDKHLNVVIEGDMRARIDRRLFHRSLANLLQNAARYADPGSTITVSLVSNGMQAEVSVSNVGEPIDSEHLEHLFERFYRADAARARSDAHHGLGLSIVRAVASMHGGRVFARSEAGCNTFGFSLTSESLA
ncbi:two-component system, OmpR family, heavy metal sensor histidine kinase CusS [Pseudomonas sp. NFACC19-2]|uniref:heavy metal sensor histidine kinase n=1 Tax=Ectopseudomonas toyotomiensis TaxID=554344 RepID=UPI00088382EB|nr:MULTISPECIES: heavy metal sensor histidine kinase [unclassified Pseudomonas]SDA81256.1 two-component system, OmpR family, heavy metal sensor histidine kinase CusS [Pseudomonas sp. NFPP33]SFW39246.1 two-component system, OmpR family, heavy metal sensor histidine kinase CusS [Pseudomonas sp. NFACC19-2]